MTGARSDQRGQAGMTLLEVMLAVMITGIIMGPLTAWVILMLRAQPQASAHMMTTIRSGFVGTYLPDDVGSATAADNFEGLSAPPGEGWWDTWSRGDCVGGSGANGRKLIALLAHRDPVGDAVGSTSSTSSTSSSAPSTSAPAGASTGASAAGPDSQLKIVYSIAASSDGDGFSVWRRTCSAADGSPIAESAELFTGVEPSSAKSNVTCRSTSGDLPCRQVKMTLTPVKTNRSVVINAVRRTDLATDISVDGGNHIPAARIDLVSQVAGLGQQSTVVLDGSSSTDKDGTIVDYRWQIPTLPVDEGSNYVTASGPDASVQTFTLPRAGDYLVELTVIDDKGASNTTYRRIQVENRSPVAVGSVSPQTVTIGQTPFSVDGRASYDPDGSINQSASYWQVTGTAVSGDEAAITLNGLFHEGLVLGPEWADGTVGFTLVVVDNDGARNVYSTSITADAMAPVDSNPEETTTTLADPMVTSTTQPVEGGGSDAGSED